MNSFQILVEFLKSGASDDEKNIPPLDKIPTNEFIDNFLEEEEISAQQTAENQERKLSDTKVPLASAHRKASVRSSKSSSAQGNKTADDDTETVLDTTEHVPRYDDTGQFAYVNACRNFQALPMSTFHRKLAERDNQVMDIKHYGMGPSASKAIAVPMVINSTVTTLNLKGNGLMATGLEPIVKMMSENDFITHLDLSENALKSAGAKLVVEMLQSNNNIEVLDLSGNGFTSSDASVLCKAIEQHANLKEVSLAQNEFGELAGKALKSMIAESDSLHKLDLSWNQLRGKASLDIAKGLKENIGLKVLNLSWNGFGDKGAADIASSLRFCTVSEVDLSSNRVAQVGIVALGKTMKANEDLKILKLGKNPIAEESVKYVLEYFKKLEELHLEVLDLSDVLFSPTLQPKIDEVVAIHSNFKCIHGYSDSYGKRKLKGYNVVGEALNAMRRYCDQHNMNIVELFSRFDADGSMSVTHEEFKLGLKEAKIALSDFQIEELIKNLDQDGDGEIDFSEMVLGAEQYKD